MGFSNFERYYGIIYYHLQKHVFIFLDLYRMCNNPQSENEAYQRHVNFSQMLLNDHFQASQMSEHNLIMWTQGNSPPAVNASPSTSGVLM